MRVCLYVCPFIRSFVLETYTALVSVETFQLYSCLHHFFSQGNLRALSRKRFRYDGSMTKRWRTKWHGQNGMDKIVYGENGIGQNGMGKMPFCSYDFATYDFVRSL